MCGRISQQIAGSTLERVIGKALPRESGAACVGYNVAPGRSIAALSVSGLSMGHWGLHHRAHYVINARLETVSERPLFRHAWQSERRIVPVNGYFEWNPARRIKQPRYHYLPGNPILCLAALRVVSPTTDSSGLVLITREALGEIADWHHRMPAFLHPENVPAFLDGEPPVWHPESNHLQAHPVTPAVNRSTYESPHCIEPVEPLPNLEQMELF